MKTSCRGLAGLSSLGSWPGSGPACRSCSGKTSGELASLVPLRVGDRAIPAFVFAIAWLQVAVSPVQSSVMTLAVGRGLGWAPHPGQSSEPVDVALRATSRGPKAIRRDGNRCWSPYGPDQD